MGRNRSGDREGQEIDAAAEIRFGEGLELEIQEEEIGISPFFGMSLVATVGTAWKVPDLFFSLASSSIYS